MPDRPDPIEAAAEALFKRNHPSGSPTWAGFKAAFSANRYYDDAKAALTASGLLAVEEERDQLRFLVHLLNDHLTGHGGYGGKPTKLECASCESLVAAALAPQGET